MTETGKPLRELLPRNGVMPLQRALRLAVSIGDALKTVYEKGGPCGLPKPTNIRVSGGDVRFASLSPSPEPVDVAYCSPEEWEGRELDERSDVFTIGAIMFECLSGVQPFARGTVEDTRAAIFADERPSMRMYNGDVPDVLEFVLGRCLRREPHKRYSSIDELCQSLQDFEEQLAHAQSLRPTDHSKRGYRLLAAIGLAAIVVGAVGAWMFFLGDRRDQGPPLTGTAIMASSGAISGPSFSPDGAQIAFSWNGERQDNFDIYLKRVGTNDAQRLTTDPDADVSPVWSPDGRYLAFVRNRGAQASIILMPAGGGPERKVHQFTRTAITSRYRLLAWSPDGHWLAFPATDDPAQGGSIYLLSLASGEVRRLTTAPSGSAFGDASPSFTADGSKLAFIRTFTGNVGDIFILPLQSYAPLQEPQRLTTTGAVTNPVWTSDQKQLLFTRFQGTSTLWRMKAEPGSSAGPMPGIGELGNFADIAGMRSGAGRLVYVRSIWDENIWRVSVSRGQTISTPEAIITSTRRDWEPHVGPDGQSLSFASERSGPAEIWISNLIGSDPKRLTSLGTFAAAARWSPDGKKIACVTDIHKQYEIYIVDVATGSATRLTNSPAHETAPSWSRDGKFVYFASNRGGSFQVWKQPPDPNAAAIPVTNTEGFAALESTDGKTLYYTKQSPNAGVWQQAVGGGAELLVIPSIAAWGNFDVCKDGIYYSTSKAPKSIEFYDFATKHSRPVLTAPKQLGFGIGVSLDGKTLLYTSIDQQANELMLVENFQ